MMHIDAHKAATTRRFWQEARYVD